MLLWIGLCLVVSRLTGAFTIPEVNLAVFDPSQGFRIKGALAGDNSARSVSNAGDVNGDGVMDILIGAYAASPPPLNATSLRTNAGIAYVIFGREHDSNVVLTDIELSSFSTSNANGFRIFGATSGGSMGYAVASVGDVNGDGVSDIMVGGYNAHVTVAGVKRTNAGMSCVIFGRNIAKGAFPFTDVDLAYFNASSILGFRVLGSANSDLSGVSITTAGDVNGDHIDDIILGAFGANANRGRAYVIFGRNVTSVATAFKDIDLLTFNTPTTLGFRILGANIGDITGLCVSNAGDFNHDGIGDMIVGARDASPVVNGVSRLIAGISYVVFGRNHTSPCHRPNLLEKLALCRQNYAGILPIKCTFCSRFCSSRINPVPYKCAY